ncbi:chromosome replication initiation inhibitor protein [Pseudomonas sp. BAY1663]|nr:chromosome replication initiation inhibitor protein [Pseudomonas sp. BAY1663]
MFDYKLLAALAAVVEQAGFERAAQTLGLSQSAVSQRVKLLEARVGQPVLLRGTPPRPTALGQRLLNHVQQVRLLERDLQGQVPALDDNRLPERLRIALNADSLATWWAGAVAPFCADHRVLLEHVVEDQAVGLKRMRAGEVAGCVCAAERPVAGARSQYLGAMRYRALASPAFIERYLPRQAAAEDLARVPAIVFGPDDRLQHRYMAAVGGTETFVHHLCPHPRASCACCRAVSAGGWCRNCRCAANSRAANWSMCCRDRLSMCRSTGTTGVTVARCWTN